MWSGGERWKLIRKKFQTGGTTIACGWGGGWTQFGRLDRKPGTLSHVYSVVYPYMEFRFIKHHKERHRKKEKNFWSDKKKEKYSTNMKEYSPDSRAQSTHRVAMATFWRIFHHDGKISQACWGWGVHALLPTSFHYMYHHVQSSGVRSSWEGRYTAPISTLPLYMYSVVPCVGRGGGWLNIIQFLAFWAHFPQRIVGVVGY
jgi:hypothetical protein